MGRDAIDQFRDALRARGIVPPDKIIDGRIGRANVDDKHGKGDASYLVFLNGVPAGGFENHRDGLGWEPWKADIGRELSNAELNAQREHIEAAKRDRDAAESQRRTEARTKAQRIWAAPAADCDHAYLKRKGVTAHGARQYQGNLVIGDMPCDGSLIIPVRDSSGDLHSLQFIAADGNKRFLPGGAKQGHYFAIGKPTGSVVVCEGFATGASIHEATGHAVAVAFDAGNLEPVARAIRTRHPDLRFIVCGDDDETGRTKAIAAASAVGGSLALPDFGSERPEGATDFNDMAAARGPAAVVEAIANARDPDAAGNERPKPRFRVITMIELVNTDLPKPEPLLAPWLRSQSLAEVHAWRGVGKTHFSLGVGYAVATAGPFLRWQAPAAYPVLFIDGEMPAEALKGRLAAIIAADDRDIDVDGSMLRFITPDLLVDTAPPDLADAVDQAELQSIIEHMNPRLIVIDNISTLVRSGGGENDAEAWLPVQGWALRMRREGRAVLFCHHSGKGGKQRGTSKREDVLDAVIALRRPDPYDPKDGARFQVEFEKARYIHGEDTRPFEAQLGTDAHGRQAWTIREIDDSTMDRVIRVVNDGITNVREIAEELGVNKSTVSRAMRKAREMGLIVNSNPERH